MTDQEIEEIHRVLDKELPIKLTSDQREVVKKSAVRIAERRWAENLQMAEILDLDKELVWAEFVNVIRATAKESFISFR